MSNTMANLKAYIKEKGIPIYIKTSVEAVASQEYTLDWNEDRSKCTIIMPRFSDNKKKQLLQLVAYIVYIEYYYSSKNYKEFDFIPIYKDVVAYKLKKRYKEFLKEQHIEIDDKDKKMIQHDIFAHQFPYNANILTDISCLLTMIFKFIIFQAKVIGFSFLFLVCFLFFDFMITNEPFSAERIQVYAKFIWDIWFSLYVFIISFFLIKKIIEKS